MKKLLVFILGTLWNFFVFAEAPTEQIVDKKATVFAVSLPANPSTGYQWKLLKFDASFLAFAKSAYVKPLSNMIGAPGNTVFTFILRPGKKYPDQTKMQFKYARPWEDKSGEVRSILIKFR